MNIPRARERVRINGRPGLFLVIWVDKESKCVHLISLDGGTDQLEENVPFSAIQAYREDVALETEESSTL